MSSWLAALGPCASPKSKAKEQRQRAGASLERPVDVVTLKRRGSLTDIRNNRKITGHSRSFREKIANTFEGSLRKAKKVGSMEAVPTSGSGPDTNMNLATSLSPKHHGNSQYSSGDKDSQMEQEQEQDKFWTNFYNTLPRNRQKGERPKDLSLQKLPVTEDDIDGDIGDIDGDIEGSPQNETPESLSPTQKDGQWQGYATSPRTRRKNKTLERMNSAPSTRKSPMRNYESELRSGADGGASQQQLDQTEVFENMANAGFVVMPRSVSLQEEYWMPATKGVSRAELRKVTPSPDRILIGHSPLGSPIQLQGHVWVKTKDGSHIELRPVERPQWEANAPSPSESQKTDTSSISYTTAASSVSNPDSMSKVSVGDGYQDDQPGPTHSTPDPQYLGPYMSPEEYQANIFDLIQSLNKSPPNPGSPTEVKPGTVLTNINADATSEHNKSFHSEKFIVLASSDTNEAPKSPVTDEYVNRYPASSSYSFPSGNNTASRITDRSNLSREKMKPSSEEREEGLPYHSGLSTTTSPTPKEQPIFSVRAHVFQIDPETKKNWIPASKSSVAVSYYYDSARNTYRIISVEGSKAIINSTITTNMAFTKTSQKFGQWSDPRANTVYGLGFSSEADLAKFIEKFKEVKNMTRQQVIHSQSPPTVNGLPDDGHSSTTSTPREDQPAPNRAFFHTRSSSLTSMKEPTPTSEQKEAVNLRERRNSFNTPGTNGTQAGPTDQLKYENDRLKLALAQSSANAKKWEIELQTLKNNNARLTAALQESTTNVDEWKKQLAGYKDESSKMKKKITEMEKKQANPDQVSGLQTEVAQLSDRLEVIDRDNRYKDEEVDRLQQRLAEMQARETANGNMQNKIKVGSLFRSSSQSKRVKSLEEENRDQQQKIHDLQQLLQDHRRSHDQDTDEILHLQDHLGSKITELYEFHEQIVATIRKESNS